jgi:exopolysaccharide biosynthesis polyprenyl glycosylphosphotransferase
VIETVGTREIAVERRTQVRAALPRHARPATTRVDPAVYVRLCRLTDTTAAVALLVLAFVLSNLGRMPKGMDEFFAIRLTVKNVLLLGAFAGAWRLLCAAIGLYDWEIVGRRREEVRRVVAACMLGSAVALLFPLISVSGAFRVATVAYFWIGATLGTLALRAAVRALSARAGQQAGATLVVGSGPRALRASRELVARASEEALVGFVDTNDGEIAETIRSRLLGNLGELEGILAHQAIDEVLVTLPIRSRYAEILQVLQTCERVGVPAKYLADVFDVGRGRARYDASSRLGVVALSAAPDDHRLVVKRAIDIVGACFALILLSPVMLLAAIAIRLTSPGPVLFAQRRYGLNRRCFTMYKFRTMVADAEERQPELEEQNEASGPVFKIRNDPRITRTGRFLRRTSIDELPQLWNVLRGDMSLVGPRPMAMRDVHRFTETALMRRFSFVPGVTGLWQTSGRSNLGFDQWVALDLKYIDEWSLALDLRILARTIPAVLRGDGAA